jgi:hypothetical protein
MPPIKIDSDKASEDATAKPSAGKIPPTPTAAATELETALLIQIPDLNAADALLDVEESSDGRIISQGLSNKLVMGVGFILVLIAVLPFLVNKKRSQKAVNELPTWHSLGTATTGTAVQPVASTPTPVAVPGPAVSYQASANVPTVSPAYLTPQQPQAGSNRPMALGDPGWPQGNSPQAAAGPTESRQDHPADYRVATAPEFRRNDRAADSQNYQADGRNDPAASYRGASAEPRADYRNTPTTVVAQGGAMMPADSAGVVSSSYQDSQTPEPGVARFEGTIAKPPVRTSYDRAGSSNN